MCDKVRNNPFVSVIVPVYNVSGYIERCARSLFEQTLQNIEYIFVNDCTPDDSMEVLNNVLQEYPNRVCQVHIINHIANTGQSGARRDGISIAKGDYIIHCDADDWVDSEMYEAMYRKAIETQADSVTCDIAMEFADYTQVLSYNGTYNDHLLMHACIAPISVEYCSMCNRLVAGKIYKNYSVVPFEGVNMWDDVGVTTMIRYYAAKCVVINKPYYHYNRQNCMSTTNRPTLERVREQVDCAKRIELFFIENGASKQYKYFISLVKLMAKRDMLYYDVFKWKEIFPETHKHLFVLFMKCGFREVVKCYLYAYMVGFINGLIVLRNKFIQK